MKHIMSALMISAFLSGLGACEKVDQTFEAVDKAKALTSDVEKKASEIKDKARGLIPESARRLLSENKESGGSASETENEKDKEGKDD